MKGIKDDIKQLTREEAQLEVSEGLGGGVGEGRGGDVIVKVIKNDIVQLTREESQLEVSEEGRG